MIERPAFYVLPYSDSTGTGAEFNVEIKLDPDAPFRLTGIALWPLGGAGVPTGSVQVRYTRPDRMWVQRHMIPGNTLVPADLRNTGGDSGANMILWAPVSPNMVYPPSGTVIFDIQTQPNIGPVAMLVVLIGTKIFRDGAVWAPTYPAQYRARPFFGYGVQVAGGALPVFNQPMPVAPDADFVWQASTYSDFGGAIASLFISDEAAGSLTFTALTPGPSAVTVQISVVFPNAPLTLNVVGSAIQVQLATNTVEVTTTTEELLNLLLADPAVTALVNITATGLGLNAPDTGGNPEALAGGSASLSNQLVDLGVRFKDYAGKYYMNDFIPVGVLFGFGFPQLPGLPYPEIYIPKNQALYFDFQWLTLPANPTTPGPNTATITLKGMKVYS